MAAFFVYRCPSASVCQKAMWKVFVVSAALVLTSAASAQESGRIKRPPPSAAEAARTRFGYGHER